MMFTRWKIPSMLLIPSTRSFFDSHDSRFPGTLTQHRHTFRPGVTVSLTTARSSNGRMILFNSTHTALSSIVK